MKCSYDPTKIPEEVGMFECPKCGEIVAAGEEHPDFEQEMEDLRMLENMTPYEKKTK